MTPSPTRRRFLRSAIAATSLSAWTAALAGCAEDAGDVAETDTTPATGPSSPSPVPTATATASENPADATVSTQPTETPEPSTSPPPTSGPDGTPTATSTDRTPTTPTADRTPTPPTADPPPSFEGYETTTVRATTPAGDHLGVVRAAIADTGSLRYLGLSDTESLPESWGMLFVYDQVGDHTFVMREMDFGIDIVYADGDGVITSIHHAPAPGPDEDGNQQRYPGRGQYVLEVNYEWTAERGVEEGDVLRFDL